MILGTFILQPAPHPSRKLALHCVGTAPEGSVVVVSEPTRTLGQNAVQWPILTAISRQLDWQINGAVCKLDADDWKNILTASFRKEAMRIAPGVDGGMVLLGARTSRFSKKEFSEWIEYLHWFAASRGVVLQDMQEPIGYMPRDQD